MHGADPTARDEEGRLPFDHILFLKTGAAQRLGLESRSGPPRSGTRRCGLSCDGNREGTRGWLALYQARFRSS